MIRAVRNRNGQRNRIGMHFGNTTGISGKSFAFDKTSYFRRIDCSVVLCCGTLQGLKRGELIENRRITAENEWKWTRVVVDNILRCW